MGPGLLAAVEGMAASPVLRALPTSIVSQTHELGHPPAPQGSSLPICQMEIKASALEGACEDKGHAECQLLSPLGSDLHLVAVIFMNLTGRPSKIKEFLVSPVTGICHLGVEAG